MITRDERLGQAPLSQLRERKRGQSESISEVRAALAVALSVVVLLVSGSSGKAE